jgi:butyrate kinase
MKCVVGNGGLMSYTGTNNVSVLEEKANQGDQKIDLYIHGMAYQVAKEIGSLYFVANGKIDAILLTGGITYSKLFMKYLENCLKGICPYKVYQGEDEMLALAQGALRVINNEEKAHTY